METQAVEQKRASIINQRKNIWKAFGILIAMYGMVYYVKTQMGELLIIKSSPEFEQINRLLPQVVFLAIISVAVLAVFKLGYLTGRLKELE